MSCEIHHAFYQVCRLRTASTAIGSGGDFIGRDADEFHGGRRNRISPRQQHGGRHRHDGRGGKQGSAQIGGQSRPQGTEGAPRGQREPALRGQPPPPVGGRQLVAASFPPF